LIYLLIPSPKRKYKGAGAEEYYLMIDHPQSCGTRKLKREEQKKVKTFLHASISLPKKNYTGNKI